MQKHFMNRWAFACAAALAIGGFAVAADTKTETPKEPPKNVRVAIEDMAAHIEEQLASKTEAAYIDTQLSDIVQDLEKRHNLSIAIDAEALSSEGKGPDTGATLRVQDVSLTSVLNRLLKPHGLSWAVVDEGILITSPAGEEKHLITTVYSVADLAGSEDTVDYDELTTMITGSVDPDSWREAGGGVGTIARISAKKALVITQTYTNHRAIASILRQLSEK
ncbi:MAG: hypothetical protein K8U03_03770 [Planctomycetia bacterium]|nr:hypothetical protein [Planctomycetia bacterium]